MNLISRWIAVLLVGTCMAAAGAEAPPPPTIAVSGHGEVTSLPDRARVALAVDALNSEVKAAESEVNAVVRRALDAFRALGIKAEDLATSSTSLQPEYIWDERKRRQVLTGYRARRDLQVVVRNLEQLGDVLLRATDAGVNHISAPVLESSRADELSREALAKAAKDARAKAETLAQALDVKLGNARIVRESSAALPPPVPYRVMAARGGAEAAFDSGNQEMGLSTGEIRIGADVQVEFDLQAR
ncbi:SIMPL domain-containing protein [Fontimonas sp. SYSU GA230001]|uniref:SIMPL domain-containing protein n=1 Tax=Fontimonas sp. SYSU GA230001 TaxID=3142450 RepID=UPI0032B35D42